MNTVLLKIDGERVVHSLQAAVHELDSSETELVLDFSGVHRIEPRALRAMEELASLADEKSATVALRDVNVEVYKVLKIAQLASRFSFAA